MLSRSNNFLIHLSEELLRLEWLFFLAVAIWSPLTNASDEAYKLGIILTKIVLPAVISAIHNGMSSSSICAGIDLNKEFKYTPCCAITATLP